MENWNDSIKIWGSWRKNYLKVSEKIKEKCGTQSKKTVAADKSVFATASRKRCWAKNDHTVTLKI